MRNFKQYVNAGMRVILGLGLSASIFVPSVVVGQDAVAVPAPIAGTTATLAVAVPTSTLGVSSTATSATVTAEPVVAATAETKAAIEAAKAAVPKDGLIRLNFRGASVDSVLDYLSKEAGFIIVREGKVEGRVDVFSHDPITKDDAVDLLNTTLNAQGYAAIRNDKILKIMRRTDAKEFTPIIVGAVPGDIPRNDEIVTQIIPIRYGDARELVESLKPLLPEGGTITTNQTSNAILVTDTQANIYRFAEIISKLGMTVSGITELKIIKLVNAQAADVVKVITSLYPATSSSSRSNNSSRGGDPRQMMMSGRGGDSRSGGGSSEGLAQQASMNVKAVADTRTNSIILVAAGDVLPGIEALVADMDKATMDTAEMRIFALRYADAEELAATLTSVFAPSSTSSSSSSRSSRGGDSRGGGDMREMMMARMMGATTSNNNNQSGLLEQEVKVVAETNTNSLIITASALSWPTIEGLIEKFDTETLGDITNRVFPVLYADAVELAETLSMIFTGSSSSSSSSSSSRNSSSSRGGRGGGSDDGPPWMRFSRDSGNDNSRTSEDTEIIIVAEERTNSIVVSAPSVVMPVVEEMLKEFDVEAEDEIVETRVFPLQYADAETLASAIEDIFEPDSRGSTSGGRGGYGSSSSGTSQRQLAEERLVVVADTRTNSLMVSAAKTLMAQIAAQIALLDANPAREKKVVIYEIENGNSEAIQAILQSMFPSSTTGNARTSTSRSSTSSNRYQSSSTQNSSRGGGSSNSSSTRGGGSSGGGR